MNILILNYTFDHVAKTITFTDYISGGISLAQVQLVYDATRKTFLFNAIDPTLTATVSSNVLTLTGIDTSGSGFANGDSLYIVYTDPTALQSVIDGGLAGGEDLTNKNQGVNHKPSAGIQYSPTIYSPLTTVTHDVLKSSRGNLLRIRVSNINASKRYLQLFNKASAPVAGTDTPIMSLIIPAGASADIPGILELGAGFFTDGGDWFTTGIAFAISTAQTTFTDAATSTDHIVVARSI